MLLRLTFLVLTLWAPYAYASETDGTVSRGSYAWGDTVGWITMAPTSGPGLTITDDRIVGYAWSPGYGWINFGAGAGVTNTPDGVLGGYAWISGLGWISLAGVSIGENGRFSGMAGSTDSPTGRISFDCGNCAVVTDWRPVRIRHVEPEPSKDAVVTTEAGAKHATNILFTPVVLIKTFIPNLTVSFPGLREEELLSGGTDIAPQGAASDPAVRSEDWPAREALLAAAYPALSGIPWSLPAAIGLVFLLLSRMYYRFHRQRDETSI